MNNMNIRASKQNNENQLRLTSEFLTASVEGKFQYHTLPASILNIMRKYVPSLILPPKSQLKHTIISNSIYIYIIQIFYPRFFDIPLTVYTHSTLKGYFNDPLQRLRVEGYFPVFNIRTTLLSRA